MTNRRAWSNIVPGRDCNRDVVFVASGDAETGDINEELFALFTHSCRQAAHL
jgi:hypothetical protein